MWGMIKVIEPGAQDLRGPVAQMIKLSRRGLIGNDRANFIKLAGHHVVDLLQHIKFADDEMPVYLLAVGSTEDYGANRNGDGFTRATCEHCHSSFKKHAYFYRDHKNKDPRKSYGLVKESLYNDLMKRIELICGLNMTKEAAERNGGLVADREVDMVSRGEDIPVSMACKVAFDVCSVCQNRARNRSEYCTSPAEGGMCKAGGLRNNMGQVLDDGHVLHADNPDPQFFDISHVFRPADRIAYVMGELEKAAAANGTIVSGAELADAMGVSAPYDLMIDASAPGHVRRQAKLAQVMAATENSISNYHPKALAFTPEVQPPAQLPIQTSEDMGRHKFASYLRALADEKIALPVQDFIVMMTGRTHTQTRDIAEMTKAASPGAFNRMLENGKHRYSIENNPFIPAPASNDELRSWARKNASAYSMSRHHVDNRVRLAALRQVESPTVGQPGDLNKTAVDSTAAAEMAHNYALYKLGFLTAIPDDPDFDLTASLCVLQNYC